jgi:hypothetical protein
VGRCQPLGIAGVRQRARCLPADSGVPPPWAAAALAARRRDEAIPPPPHRGICGGNLENVQGCRGAELDHPADHADALVEHLHREVRWDRKGRQGARAAGDRGIQVVETRGRVVVRETKQRPPRCAGKRRRARRTRCADWRRPPESRQPPRSAHRWPRRGGDHIPYQCRPAALTWRAFAMHKENRECRRRPEGNVPGNYRTIITSSSGRRSRAFAGTSQSSVG